MSFQGQEVRGIFWPTDLWKKHRGEEPHPDMVRDISLPSGIQSGIVAEDDGQPLPIGCVRLFNVAASGTEEVRQLGMSGPGADTDDADLQLLAQKARGKMASSIQASATQGKDGSWVAGGSVALRVKHRAQVHSPAIPLSLCPLVLGGGYLSQGVCVCVG